MSELRRFWALVRESLAGNEPDVTRGPVGRGVMLLAIPMMLEMAMESIFAVVDIFFVGRLGADAVAVVGLTEAVITPLYAVAVGLSMGVTAMVSRRVGAGNISGARDVAGQAVLMGLVVSVAVGVIGFVYAERILAWMGAAPSVVESGAQYTQFMLGGAITIVYLFLLNAVFRGAGDATIALKSLCLANGINIVLDPCLIYGVGPFPELGVTGAAVATNIGRGIGVVYQLYCLSGAHGRVTIGLGHLRLRWAVMIRLLRVSLGGVLQFLIATSSWIVLVRIVAPYGSAAVAGYTIGLRLLEFTFLPAWGLGNAAATLVGQNLGAGKPERAERSVWKAAQYNATFLITVGLVFIAAAPVIVGWFTNDAEVLDYGVAFIRIVALGYGFYAVGTVIVQAFNGAGDTDTPTVINLICFWGLQIPLAYWLAERLAWGPEGVFVAIVVAESLIAVFGIVLFRRGRWRQRTL